MAYSQADLDALQAAMAKGVLRVKLDGEEVWYRSIDEMLKVERRIKIALGQISEQRLIMPVTSSGWRSGGRTW